MRHTVHYIYALELTVHLISIKKKKADTYQILQEMTLFLSPGTINLPGYLEMSGALIIIMHANKHIIAKWGIRAPQTAMLRSIRNLTCKFLLMLKK